MLATTDASCVAVLQLTAYRESGEMTPDGARQRIDFTPHQVVVDRDSRHKDAGAVTMDQPHSMTITL